MKAITGRGMLCASNACVTQCFKHVQALQACVNVAQLSIKKSCRPQEYAISNSSSRQDLGGIAPAYANVHVRVFQCTANDLLQVK